MGNVLVTENKSQASLQLQLDYNWSMAYEEQGTVVFLFINLNSNLDFNLNSNLNLNLNSNLNSNSNSNLNSISK